MRERSEPYDDVSMETIMDRQQRALLGIPQMVLGYIQDSNVSSFILKKLMIGGTWWKYISPNESSKDGRDAYLSVNSHFKGKSQTIHIKP